MEVSRESQRNSLDSLHAYGLLSYTEFLITADREFTIHVISSVRNHRDSFSSAENRSSTNGTATLQKMIETKKLLAVLFIRCCSRHCY